MSRVFIDKPWIASITLSVIFLFFILIVRIHTAGVVEYGYSLFVLIGTYLTFFAIAFWNVGHLKSIRETNWPRIKQKAIVIFIQLSIIFFFAHFTSNLINIGVYYEFIDNFILLFPFIISLLPIYIRFVDCRVPNPNDDYAQFGEWIENFDWKKWRNHRGFLLKTIVKMIFVPFMLGGLIGNINILLNTHISNINSISNMIFNIVISIDMIVGAFGYLFSSALLDNQIKDTDKNILGWIFCLACYPPLVWIMSQVNQQSDVKIWTDFMQPDMPIYWLFFIVINGLWIIYLSSSFSFGMSFSNLSWRYLIDFGIFRYTKHPAYIAKNLYWWLYTLPFLGVAWFSPEWWRNILGLSFVSLIYYGRAKSEERHLSQFPEYQAYMERVEKEGIFRWLNKSYWQQKTMN